MDGFLKKYYPDIKKSFHKKRIFALRELLKEVEESYKEEYHEVVE